MRAWASLRVILNAEGIRTQDAHTFVCLIVQVDVCYFCFGRQRISIYTEVVILASDFNGLGCQISNRMICSMMTERQLKCLAAKRQRLELMT